MRHGRESALSAFLICPDREISSQFQRSQQEARAFEVVGELAEYPARNTLEIRLRQIRPEVVVVDASSDLSKAIETIEALSAHISSALVVGLHRHNDSNAVISVLRAGAAEFLYSPFEVAVQREALARLRRIRQPEDEAPSELGKVFVFTSSKPGSGSSTVATHAAHAIRQKSGKRVLLADFDLEGGSIGFYLKLQANYSTADAIENADQIDAAIWAALTVESAGVDVLVAPEVPYTASVEQARLHDLIEYSRMLYDYVLIDVPPVFHRTSLLSISECDQAYLITSADLASLHLTRKAIGFLAQLGFEKDRYQVVVNRLGKKDSISTADIEKIFGSSVRACIPNEYFSLHRVISLGQPLVADCELGKSIADLAVKLMGGRNGTSKKTSVGNAPAAPALSRA
ncbi:MAG: P-loop NTPase [Bryobacterales bacterium]|nr:P-loop NTPase [Bryobacterales bacterium]